MPPPVPLVSTLPYPDDLKSPGPLPGEVKVALVTGRGPPLAGDIQALLGKRLRFFAFLFAVPMAIVVLIALLTPGTSLSDIAVHIVVCAVLAGLAGVLWKKPSLSLRQLRVIELLLFGSFFAFWTFIHAGANAH